MHIFFIDSDGVGSVRVRSMPRAGLARGGCRGCRGWRGWGGRQVQLGRPPRSGCGAVAGGAELVLQQGAVEVVAQPGDVGVLPRVARGVVNDELELI